MPKRNSSHAIGGLDQTIRPKTRVPNRRASPRRTSRRTQPTHEFTPILRFVHQRLHDVQTFLQAILRTPLTMRVFLILVLLFVMFLSVNWLYHAFYKPTELLFPVERSLQKIPRETWREYGSLFTEHSTAAIPSELLAALAQAEGSGNPVARTYWRWRFTSWNPLEWYQPASTAVGMFQVTNGTFQEAKRYCIHSHVVVEDGPWHQFDSCWFNHFYTRVRPSDAIELTAAHLDRHVSRLIGNQPATAQQKQDLAAVIHLCGAGAGRDYVNRKYRLIPNQHCGEHDVKQYLTKIALFKQQFVKLKTY